MAVALLCAKAMYESLSVTSWASANSDRKTVSPPSTLTDSFSHPASLISTIIPATGCSKIRQLSVAPLIAETIQRIAKGESVMSLFSDQENLF
jgi:hypothetical protein